MGFEPSAHAREMLQKRQIPEEWMWRTLSSPDRQEVGAGGNIHTWQPELRLKSCTCFSLKRRDSHERALMGEKTVT